MKNNGGVDFHSHILPGMDDGSRDAAESLEMLRASAAYGVDTMVATSHYYARRETPEEFLTRRARALETLEAVRTPGLPRIVPAAEVCFFAGMSRDPALDRLCIGKSRYLLLELPFEPWSRSVLQEVGNLVHVRGITPILAHIERYLKLQRGTGRLEELLSYDVLVQMNAEFINSMWTGGKALRMLGRGEVQLLGSDCHNMADRRPNLGAARAAVARKLGGGVLDEIDALGRHILENA